MTSDTSQETTQVTMDTLRRAFARYCKILEIDQITCLALTLLLNSKESMITMLRYLDWAEKEGIKPSKTMVEKVAQQIFMSQRQVTDMGILSL